MRAWWMVVWIGCAGCWTSNPAFLPTEGSTDATDATAASTRATATGDASSTGEPEPTTGSVVSVCGDGKVEGNEVCDPPSNKLELGACLAQCDGRIPKKWIFAAPMQLDGSFADGADIAAADARCTATAVERGLTGTFKALIADHTQRWASTAPFLGDCSDDWPIQSYTAYFNPDDQPVWVTGELRLLGVTPGPNPGNTPAELPAAIAPEAQFTVWTGLAATWETQAACEGWKGGEQAMGTIGKPYLTTNFLDAGGYAACTDVQGLICVEQ